MTSDFDARCQRLLVELGLCDPADRPEVTPLTGGVASDIARVRVGGQDYCVKFALEKLKVAADWHAPVHRNAAEYAWLKVVAQTLPHAAPRLYGRSAREGGFAMEYLAGPDIYLWKSAMLSAAPDRGEAAAMGATLGQIHAASTAPGFDAAPFQNRADFHALRIEPYLLFTASRHPDLAAHLTALAAGLDHAATVLVHGDVSPKNILFRNTGPVILDAECATMGDASFDVAFCLNHLILKALHVWPSRTRLLGDVQLFWNAYAPHITWEDADALEARIAALLPVLMLARVDGKSPVEYLTQPEAALIRRITPALITDPTDRLADLSALLTDQFKGQYNVTAIKSVTGRRVWDSRGNPTVEVDVVLENGILGRAIAPAGASRGTREAIDLRDGGRGFRGLDVQDALRSVATLIAPALIGRDVADQAGADQAILALDPSPLKSRIGGNAAIATSLAVLHAAAADAGLPLCQHIAAITDQRPSLPLPEIQIFGGGAHAGRRVDIQDFMIMVPGASSFAEALEITNEVYFAAGDIMQRRGKLAGVADEGGWWPQFDSNEQALETLVAAIEKAGEKPGDRVVLSLDIAASEFGKDGRYHLALEDRVLETGALIEMLGGWLDTYPIASIEDPVGEDDPIGMAEFTRRFGDRVQIIGDDYLVTNAGLIRQAAADGACNAVLIKVNQAGTVTEALAAFAAAEAAEWGAIVSARSGESEDVSISHLSTGLGCGQLKVGSFTRSERMAKWNECLRIEEVLGRDSFVGGAPLGRTWWGRINAKRKTA